MQLGIVMFKKICNFYETWDLASEAKSHFLESKVTA